MLNLRSVRSFSKYEASAHSVSSSSAVALYSSEELEVSSKLESKLYLFDDMLTQLF